MQRAQCEEVELVWVRVVPLLSVDQLSGEKKGRGKMKYTNLFAATTINPAQPICHTLALLDVRAELGVILVDV